MDLVEYDKQLARSKCRRLLEIERKEERKEKRERKRERVWESECEKEWRRVVKGERERASKEASEDVCSRSL